MNFRERFVQFKLNFQRLFHKEKPALRFRKIKIDGKEVSVREQDIEKQQTYREEMGLPPLVFADSDIPGKAHSTFIGGDVPVVKHVSPLLDHTGYSQASRNEVFAMASVGIPMTLEPLILDDSRRYKSPHWLKKLLKKKDENFDIVIVHLTPEHIIQKVPLEMNKYYVSRFYWETDCLPKEFIWSVNRTDEVWAFDEKRKHEFIKAGVRVPVHVIPQCVRPPSSERGGAVNPSYMIDESRPPEYVFYSIFQWTERKNPRALLRAYWREFGPDDKVLLCLKTYEATFTDEAKGKLLGEFHRWRRDEHLSYYPPVYLYLDYLKSNEIVNFHLMGDCYVSPSRGEGWNVPLGTALQLGSAAIYTNSGGLSEYLPKVLDHKMTPCFGMDWIPWYSYNQQWCEVDLGGLRKKMREYYENPKKAYRVGAELQKFVHQRFAPQVVGQEIKDRIREIRKEMNHGL